ncbi:hypothetical protein HNY73_005182 [Argiope bruennichi]|uniref:Uncharacterized protein n=1 Tax=Argiope bruennichi TaxID=94029 RepID=A0A8T0FIS1_ARGBR|nr:hypothetical protein HNY73_005182 [Argiope bruennichi]
MDLEHYHYLKYKVTHSMSAVFADNITKVMMSLFNIPWEMEFASDEDNYEFVDMYEDYVLLDFYVLVAEANAILDIDPTLWYLDEDTFMKLLHDLKMEFIAVSSKCEYLLLDISSKMLYYASIFYKRGLKNAPIVAFLHVYRLACGYYKPGGW